MNSESMKIKRKYKISEHKIPVDLLVNLLVFMVWKGLILLFHKLLNFKYVNFWVIPRRLVYIGRRFGTLCQVHLQRLDV
jgi:hypothetical protein